MIQDAFKPVSYWDNFMLPPKYQDVFLDTHIYQVFTVAVREFHLSPSGDTINLIWVEKSNERVSTHQLCLWNAIHWR
jgi:hypothetical protein